jgi:putative ABC transport system permease protein
MIPIRYNIRSLAVRKATTIATALGIALVVFVLSASQMLSNGVRNTLTKAGPLDHAIVLRKGADAELASSVETPRINLILSAPGVKKDASGKPQGSAEIMALISAEKPNTGGQMSNVAVRGLADNGLAFHSDVKVVEGQAFRAGSDEAIVGKRLAGQFIGVELGGSIELKKNRPLKVVGIFEADGSSLESEVLADIEVVRSAFAREGSVSSVTVALESPSKFDAFKAAMESDRQLGLAAYTARGYYEKQSEGTSMLVNVIGGAIVFFFSIGATIGAMITMYAAVAHRKREIGTLRALGFSRFTVLASFLLESIVLTLIGGVAGALASLAMGQVKFSMMNWASWSEVTFSFDASPSILVTALAIGGLMGVLGGFLPALRAARTSPTEAMRD